MTVPDSESLYFLPLGGSGEIGTNLNLYGHAGQWMMVDLGVSFGDETMPMIDVVMPDPAWIVERRDRLAGLVLTHGHEDHLGAVHYLWERLRCPVYATPFTALLLEDKLREAGLLGQVPLHVMPLGSRFNVGPFDVEMISMTHSMPEPNALAIRTPVGTVLHTGDWKFDPDPLVGGVADCDALRRVGREGVLAMIGDSTNILSPGESGSESTVRANLFALLGQFTGKVAVSCFATNVARLESIALAAEANGRRVALVGRSLWRIEKAARALGYLKDIAPFLTEHDAGYMPDREILLLCTGSQGEARAALARIAADDHPHVTLGKGDAAVFSSRVIPGNEKAIFKLQNDLIRLGVTVVTDRDAGIHVSGHPSHDEVVRMYQMIQPRIAIPVHGEARHVQAHCAVAAQCGCAQTVTVENGSLVRLTADEPAEIVDHVETGRLAVDGPRLIRLDSDVVRDRRRMVFNGSAVCTVVLDRHGRLVTDPQVTALGLLDGEAANDERDAVVEAAREAVEDLSHAGRMDDDVAREAIRRAVRRTIRQIVGHKAVTTVHLVRI